MQVHLHSAAKAESRPLAPCIKQAISGMAPSRERAPDRASRLQNIPETYSRLRFNSHHNPLGLLSASIDSRSLGFWWHSPSTIPSLRSQGKLCHIYSSMFLTIRPSSIPTRPRVSPNECMAVYFWTAPELVHLAAASCGEPFSNVSFSIAASIILFPLMIEVVQMTMFRRAVPITQVSAWINTRKPRAPPPS